MTMSYLGIFLNSDHKADVVGKDVNQIDVIDFARRSDYVLILFR